MIGGYAVESLSACRESTENISAADNDSNLDAERVHILDLASNAANNLRINAECFFTHERFATELQQDALVFCIH